METKKTIGNEQIDEAICPLCGGDNRCGYLANPHAGTCWCVHDFPKEIVERVPEHLKGKACICPECVERFKAGKR
jgi:hypothetical protein